MTNTQSTTTDVNEGMLTRAEAAELAGVTVRTITRWQRDGLIRTYRGVTNRVRFKRAEVLEIVRCDPDPEPPKPAVP